MEEDQGFAIIPRLSYKVHPVTLTDLYFTDDIVLIEYEPVQGQELLSTVETQCANVGLHLNPKKTE